MKKWALIAAAALLIGPLLVWLFAVPDSLIPNLIEKEAAKQDLSLKVNGFEKGIFLTFKADDVIAFQKGTELIRINRLKGSINPFSLFLLKVNIPFSGTISEGTLDGEITLKFSSRAISARIENANTAGVPVLAGVAHGSFSGDLSMKNDAGAMSFTLKDISRAPLNINEANGLLAIANGEVILKSVSMEGENINAKLKGTIKNGFYRLTAEVMPRGEGIPENELLKYSLPRYEVSPGYYVIPLSGELRRLP